MKKIYAILALSFLSSAGFAQLTSASIAVQFYVDANNNCTYDLGEQIVNNLQAQISYSTPSGIATAMSSGSFQTCASQTLYCWNAVAAPINTITILSGGVTQNPCGNYTNVPYGTNTMQYLPVIVSGASNVGVQANLISMAPNSNGFNYQNFPSGSTISICSNMGFDSLTISMNISNIFGCSNTNTMSPRTYSIFCDNVLLDWFTVTGNVNSSTNVTGVNSNVTGWEWYTVNNTNLWLYPDLPSTFTATGTHTLEVKSTLIYNNASSFMDYVAYFNPVPCARISGRFYNDCNNNCTFDAGDTYGVGSNATGYIYDGNSTNITFHPDLYTGDFNVIVPASSAYSLTQYPTPPATNYTACTTGTITIAAATTVTNLLYGYQNNVPSNGDPAVYISRINGTSNIISPLVGATFGVYINNWMWNLCTSNTINNPGVLKVVLPKFFSYVSNVSGPTPTVNTSGLVADTLIYAIPNFTNTTWTTPVVSFSAVVSATAVANTLFAITAYIYPSVDVNLLNNVHPWTRSIGGPFDPNGKYCQTQGKLANGDIPFGTQDFIYEIGFQNIGNAPAINVTTEDTIDSNFDLSTLRVLQSSFPVTVQKNNVTRAVHFHFKNINLAGSQVDEPNSHGFVRYHIKLKPNVPVNTVLKNRAHNYFDFLEPVATNQTSNKLVSTVGIDENGEFILGLRAVPNPFGSRVRIESTQAFSAIKVYNVSGQLIMEAKQSNADAEINMESQPSGVYLIEVKNVSGSSNFIKVIKQ